MESSPFIGIDYSALIGKRKQFDYSIIATYITDPKGNQRIRVKIYYPLDRKEVVIDI